MLMVCDLPCPKQSRTIKSCVLTERHDRIVPTSSEIISVGMVSVRRMAGAMGGLTVYLEKMNVCVLHLLEADLLFVRFDSSKSESVN